MHSQRHAQAATVPLQQLKAIQERAAGHKDVLLTVLAHVLATNDPIYPELSEETYSLARKVLHGSRVDLRHLELLILDITDREVLASVRSIRAEIDTYYNQFRTTLHPMRSLPDDILLLIFQWCTTTHEYRKDHHGSLDGRYPSWTMTHVCSRWRYLALASPSPRSIVHLCRSLINEDAILSRLNLQLQRSGNMPLAVTFDENSTCSYMLAGRDRTTSLLRSTTDRWWSLNLCMILPEDEYDDDAVFEGCSFSNLTHLTVRENTFTGEHNIPLSTFCDAPRLTHVSLLGEYLIDLIWDSVEVYRTSMFSLAVHSQLPSLRELTVDASAPDIFEFEVGFEVFDDIPPIHLPRLVTLVLLCDNPNIFNQLSMPCLETLHLRLPSYECRDYPDLQPYSRHLRNLCIVSGYMGNYHLDMEHLQLLITFLKGASQVTALYLHDTSLLRTSMFRMEEGGDGMFSYLESLRVPVSIFWDTEVDVGEIEAIVKSRLCAPTTRIREVRLIGDFFDHLSMPDRITSWNVIVGRLHLLGVEVTHAISNVF